MTEASAANGASTGRLPPGSRPYLILAAHPDDEVIGLASFLRGWAHRAVIVHVTDGSPADLRDARAAGYATCNAYAKARRKEAEAALGLAGIPSNSILSLGFQDQDLSYRLAELVGRLVRLLEQVSPEIVFVHPFEGGHPDHDSISFGAALAATICRTGPRLLEFCSYHARGDRIVTSDFLAHERVPVCTKTLSPAESALKQKMLDTFITQARVLKIFSTDVERIRPAPAYDYHRPPHAGRLYYEGRISNMTGAAWCSLAASAEKELLRKYAVEF